jgi:hypothetical protein
VADRIANAFDVVSATVKMDIYKALQANNIPTDVAWWVANIVDLVVF